MLFRSAVFGLRAGGFAMKDVVASDAPVLVVLGLRGRCAEQANGTGECDVEVFGHERMHEREEAHDAATSR